MYLDLSGLYLAWSGVLDGASLTKAGARVEENLVEAWLMDCKVWPFANFLAFSMVPTIFRPSFIGVVQVGWQAYMSWICHRDNSCHGKKEETIASMIPWPVLPQLQNGVVLCDDATGKKMYHIHELEGPLVNVKMVEGRLGEQGREFNECQRAASIDRDVDGK